VATDFDAEKGDDIETIRKRLGEAMAWFEHAANSSDDGFPRSANLHPSHLETNRKTVVRWVAERRTYGVKAPMPRGVINGRLLGYGPDETVLDGASEGATHGFFNWEDEPPWDLWLGWMVETSGGQYLVSWIPPSLLKTAQEGIDANPVDCIHWLPELEEALGLEPQASY
jgi:hypothetical protein